MSNRSHRKSRKKQSGSLLKILILVGFVVLVAVFLLLKEQPAQPTQSPEPIPVAAEVQLDQYLSEGKPTFVFFHSNNCKTCLDMITIVDQVYPEFSQTVALVDVNVYDSANQSLLQRANITSIPTQVFIDSTGAGQVSIGLMTADSLRQQLLILAATAQ